MSEVSLRYTLQQNTAGKLVNVLPTAVSHSQPRLCAANEEIFELLGSFHFLKEIICVFYYYPAPHLPVRLNFLLH